MSKINCPNCHKVLSYQTIKDLPYFPFCGERCKLVDLGAWLDEKYRIEEPMSPDALTRLEKKGVEHG
ncbi:MAG TPA: DNA gyrase inhibitor YacG [Candidatus Brocadiaceae bacterium]